MSSVQIALMEDETTEISLHDVDFLFQIEAHGNGVRFRGAWPSIISTKARRVWGYRWAVGDGRSVSIPFDDGPIDESDVPFAISLTPYFDAPFEDMQHGLGIGTRLGD